MCILGQPGSIERTATRLREFLLEHWNDTDAFVFGHYEEADTQQQSTLARLRTLLGPRLIEANLSDGVDPQTVAQAKAWTTGIGWNPHGHALQQWVPRADCVSAIYRQEALRGAEYEVYVRLRLDSLLLEPVPLTAREAVLRVEPCAALVPEGEDFGNMVVNDLLSAPGCSDWVKSGCPNAFAEFRRNFPSRATWTGINDRFFISRRCGMVAEASIVDWMSKISPKQKVEYWNLEMAQRARLNASNITLIRAVPSDPAAAAATAPQRRQALDSRSITRGRTFTRETGYQQTVFGNWCLHQALRLNHARRRRWTRPHFVAASGE